MKNIIITLLLAITLALLITLFFISDKDGHINNCPQFIGCTIPN